MGKIEVTFDQSFNGEVQTPEATIKVGKGQDKVLPYDMLYGALASCLYSTFLDIAVKKRITYEKVLIEVEGEKRTEIPTTLKWVKVKFKVYHADKSKGLDKALQLATEYCSVYQTISHVAEMSYELELID